MQQFEIRQPQSRFVPLSIRPYVPFQGLPHEDF